MFYYPHFSYFTSIFIFVIDTFRSITDTTNLNVFSNLKSDLSKFVSGTINQNNIENVCRKCNMDFCSMFLYNPLTYPLILALIKIFYLYIFLLPCKLSISNFLKLSLLHPLVNINN